MSSSLFNPIEEKVNYSAGVNFGEEFTATFNAAMYVQQTFSSTGNLGVHVVINGEDHLYPSGGNYGAWVCPFLLETGDTVKLWIENSRQSVSAICYPRGS